MTHGWIGLVPVGCSLSQFGDPAVLGWPGQAPPSLDWKGCGILASHSRFFRVWGGFLVTLPPSRCAWALSGCAGAALSHPSPLPFVLLVPALLSLCVISVCYHLSSVKQEPLGPIPPRLLIVPYLCVCSWTSWGYCFYLFILKKAVKWILFFLHRLVFPGALQSLSQGVFRVKILHRRSGVPGFPGKAALGLSGLLKSLSAHHYFFMHLFPSLGQEEKS